MKIIVFGATGMTGIQLVKQALYKGHSVKAFGRNVFTASLPTDEKIELVQGALFDAGQVQQAIQGCDAVLSALGGATDGNDKTRSIGIKNIIEQMKKAGLKRIIAIGGLGILNATEEELLIDGENYPKEYLAVGNEHRKAWEYLKESGLDWTFVCAPDIIDHGPSGLYTTSADYPTDNNKGSINSGDLAMFMVNELDKQEYLQKRVGISN